MSKKKPTKNTKVVEPVKTEYSLKGNATSHTDIVKQIKEIQDKFAVDNPQQSTGVPYDFSKSHLHIGIPCYGGLILESTMTSLIKFILLANRAGLNWSLDTMVNESLITRGRNNLMAKMMSNPAATHFMFIDADIRFEAESILQMMAANKDIISGAYPKKAYPIQVNINLKQQTKLQGPLYTVDTAATGFLMFKRNVYEKLIEAHKDKKYVDDVGLGKQYEQWMYAIFDCYIDSKGHYLSEDWAFCRRADVLGYDIWCDSRVVLNHTGTHEFRGDLSLVQGPLANLPKQ